MKTHLAVLFICSTTLLFAQCDITVGYSNYFGYAYPAHQDMAAIGGDPSEIKTHDLKMTNPNMEFSGGLTVLIPVVDGVEYMSGFSYLRNQYYEGLSGQRYAMTHPVPLVVLTRRSIAEFLCGVRITHPLSENLTLYIKESKTISCKFWEDSYSTYTGGKVEVLRPVKSEFYFSLIFAGGLEYNLTSQLSTSLEPVAVFRMGTEVNKRTYGALFTVYYHFLR